MRKRWLLKSKCDPVLPSGSSGSLLILRPFVKASAQALHLFCVCNAAWLCLEPKPQTQPTGYIDCTLESRFGARVSHACATCATGFCGFSVDLSIQTQVGERLGLKKTSNVPAGVPNRAALSQDLGRNVFISRNAMRLA